MNTTLARSQKPLDSLPTRAIDRYFSTMNQGLFTETATLFAPNGILALPLIPQIKGQAAIAAYLEKAAQGICLKKFAQTHKPFTKGKTQVDVRGRVETCFFEANVDWTFLLSADDTIAFLQIKLRVSLEELNKLRPTLNRVACG
jgi:hypothetical protein